MKQEHPNNKFESLFYSVPKYARDIQANLRLLLNPEHSPLISNI